MHDTHMALCELINLRPVVFLTKGEALGRAR
jgi:hypothetical protein